VELFRSDVEALSAGPAVARDLAEPAHHLIPPASGHRWHDVFVKAARATQISRLDIQLLVYNHQREV
jgi:hypothetical protein